ncbi:FAD-dependent oxidoreductase [Paenibacillus sp. FSL K6-3166]|uniref:bile acid Fe-S flavoenzyme BaiCD n=1 Tax=unclassified Paenibacillus TaxID=185978 RepID=UPI000BA06370|nr:FAD-dependent oxidoreductase [Paenibacillus sp. VTT E-133291]OZQ97757.1 NADH oxidase [Paenibacillus sp. VTT E-133291]
MEFAHLFSKGMIGNMELKNRVILPAMGTKMNAPGGYVGERLIDYHVARAKGGNGLNTVEVTTIHPTAASEDAPAIYDDKFIPGMTRLAQAIHDAGGKSCLQLWHGGKVTPNLIQVSSSPVPFEGVTQIPRELEHHEVSEMVQAYADAALRAKIAGFDSVEFHAGHGYLPQQFLSPAMNFRQDEYGGSWENRCRFPLACIRAIREAVGPGFPILMRISAIEDLPGGLTLDEMKLFSKLAEKAGIDAINVSRGVPAGAAIKYEVPPIDLPVGFNVDNAAQIKSVVNIPVIAVGRINDPAIADRIIAEGLADFVAIGRAQLADPEFCNKALAGRADTIVKCVGCDQGCFDGFVNPKVPFISCVFNPATGREREYELKPAGTPKKVLIAGGGPAGLEAAVTLKRRGHSPILCEKNDILSGQLYIAGAAPRKEEMAAAALNMGEAAKREGVEIRMNTEVTPELIQEISPDEVILAIGSAPTIPPIEGVLSSHVVNSHDVLWGTCHPEGRVVIIGGGLVGLEVAELLVERGNQITVVEMQADVANDLGILRKICVMESLYGHGVTLMTNSKCKAIQKNSVIVEKDGELHKLPADYVVIAVGSHALNKQVLQEFLEESSIPYHVIGDAVQARRALNAIWEGAELARRI